MEIEFLGGNTGYNVQSELNTFMRNKFYPAVLSLFDSYSLEDYHLLLPKLEFELQISRSHFWDDDLLEQSIKKIKEHLDSILNSIDFDTRVLTDNNSKSLERSEDDDFHLVTKEMRTIEILVHFLRTGIFIENRICTNVHEFIALLDFNSIEPDIMYRHFNKYRLDSNFLKRWISYIPLVKKFEFVKAIYSDEANVLNYIEKLIGDCIFQKNISNPGQLKKSIDRFGQRELMLWKFVFQLKGDKSHRDWKTEWEVLELEDISFETFAENIKDYTVEAEQAIMEMKHSIPNAGLVLIHPFLHELFHSLHYMEDGKWKSPDLQERAAYLLHSMTSDDSIANENEQILPKILCGIPVENFMEVQEIINDHEKSICREMIHTIINYWEVVKDSSIESIITSFLRREGYISQLDKNEFYLELEEHGVDVLLDYLPWSISEIQLAWMSVRLDVLWNY